MTPKQKISALKKTRKVFAKIAESNLTETEIKKKYEFNGICDYTYWIVFTDSQRKPYQEEAICITPIFEKEFKVRMPQNDNTYKWSITPKGYQARVRAIDKAIEKLEKEIK